jgi:hypothetical protein
MKFWFKNEYFQARSDNRRFHARYSQINAKVKINTPESKNGAIIQLRPAINRQKDILP